MRQEILKPMIKTPHLKPQGFQYFSGEYSKQRKYLRPAQILRRLQKLQKRMLSKAVLKQVLQKLISPVPFWYSQAGIGYTVRAFNGLVVVRL